MRKLVYFIASTIDGFIAARDGATDVFPMSQTTLRQIAEEFPETFPTHLRPVLGIAAPNARFDTVIMGRGTYHPAFSQGITSPYAHLRQIVFSRSLPSGTDPAVTVVAGNAVPVVRRLKAERTGKDIWLCGGDLAKQLIDEIDELILKLNPIALGEGRPLFAGPIGPRAFTLVDARSREAGVVQLRYAATQAPPARGPWT